jgi:hypothetical protein
MSEIRASRINLLFERMNLIISNGAGESGYGQGQGPGYGSEPLSYPVSSVPGSNAPIIVSASDINAFYADMLRCRIHQIGTEPTEIAQLISNLNVIAEQTSFFVDQEGNTATDPEGTKKGIRDYELLMTQIEADKFLAHPSQMVVEPAINSFRLVPWNGTNVHEFTVTFRNANHRRHFFNSGGEIRFSASNSGSPSLKGQDWNTLLTNIGTVKFNYRTTQSTTATGTTSNIGNYQLTNNYQLLYRKTRANSASGVYDGNQYIIEGRQISPSQIGFKVSFIDLDTAGAFNDNVDGRLESLIRVYRASGPTSIAVPIPDFTTEIDLATAAVPLPPVRLSLSDTNPTLVLNQTITPINSIPTGGDEQYVFSIDKTLPNGLVFDAVTGRITGTPTSAPFSDSYIVTVTDGRGITATARLNLAVTFAPMTLQLSSNLAVLTQNRIIDPITSTTTGGDGNYTYSISPTLPNGLQINSSTGVIAGSPTTAPVTKSYRVTVTDGTGATAFADLSINIRFAQLFLALSGQFVKAKRNKPIDPILSIPEGGDGNYTFTISPQLPQGLTFNSLDGSITGNPTSIASLRFYTITLTDSRGISVSEELSIEVEEEPVTVPIIGCDITQGVTGVGQGLYTYTLDLGTFTGPAGISYNGYASIPDNFTITWGNQTVTTGFVTGRGTLTFNKTASEPQTATLTVDATRSGTLFDWSVICPPNPPTVDNVVAISVIDESSPTASTIRSDWLTFRNNYPTRQFWLLQPGRTAPELKAPAEFTADTRAEGPIQVARDGGIVSARSDWFAITGLASVPAGTIVSLAIDSTGSLGLSRVRASYDFFIEQCQAAGLQVVFVTFNTERWSLPHNREFP